MNKTRKILFFDIDGTLITDDGKRYFPDSAKEAIQKASGKGCGILIKKGQIIKKIDEKDILSTLKYELDNWSE